jgi:RNA polymerase sigma factor (TIGR02999 family)
MRRFSQKGLTAPGSAHDLARARASDSRMSFGSVGVAPALVQSNAVRELLSDDGGVHGGTLEHRHHDRGDGAAPVGLELLVPRRRTFVDGTNDHIAHNEVVLWLHTPSYVLRAEIPERILQHGHVFQISDYQRQRGLEVSLERGHVSRKERSKGGRSYEQLQVEAGRQRAGLGGHFGEAAFETCDTFGCHTGAAVASGPTHPDGPATSGELVPEVYDELRKLARARLARERQPNQTLQATALVHESYLRVSSQPRQWERRGHFFAAAALAMRRILVERARHYQRIKHSGGAEHVEVHDEMLGTDPKLTDVIAVDEALTQLEATDPRKAKVVVLRYFAGLTVEEIAGALNVSQATVKNEWMFARAWLFRVLGSPERADRRSE